MHLLIVDDEQLARDRLERMVEKIDAVTQVSTAENGQQALDFIASNQVDLMLLDIAMPGLDGMATAKALAEQASAPSIIFCTAYENHALEAFGVKAVGYLLKPVRQSALEESIAHVIQLRGSAVPAPAVPQRKHIRVKHGNNVSLIPLRDVRCFRADQKYVAVVTPEHSYLIEESLKELEEEFSELFVRVHRNTLVAKSHITGLQTPNQTEKGASKLLVVVEGVDEGIDVSRRHLSEIKRLVSQL